VPEAIAIAHWQQAADLHDADGHNPDYVIGVNGVGWS
jgi:hypothetical protein